MSDLNEIIYKTVDKLMKKKCTKQVIENAEHGEFPLDLWNDLKDLEITSFGSSNDSMEQLGHEVGLKILKIVGNYSVPIPLAENFVSNLIFQKKGLDNKNKITTFISPVNAKNLNIIKSENKWNINGSVKHVAFARHVDQIIVFGKTDKGKLKMGLIDSKDKKTKVEELNNIAGEARDGLHFNNSKLNDVFDITECELKWIYHLGTLTRVVLMAGALESILALSIQFSKEREQFGRPIGKFQAIRQQLAILTSHILTANTVANNAIHAFSENEDMYKSVALSKISINEAVNNAVPIAHQIHAAMGFTYEHPLHHSTRRLWSWREEFGTETDWSQKLGKNILNNAHDSLWGFISK